jgi:hypothetical protein
MQKLTRTTRSKLIYARSRTPTWPASNHLMAKRTKKPPSELSLFRRAWAPREMQVDAAPWIAAHGGEKVAGEKEGGRQQTRTPVPVNSPANDQSRRGPPADDVPRLVGGGPRFYTGRLRRSGGSSWDRQAWRRFSFPIGVKTARPGPARSTATFARRCHAATGELKDFATRRK